MTNCLVVDTNRAERLRISKLLSALKFDLAEAHDGREALEKCANQMPDVIMINHTLGDMEAGDFLDRLLNAREPRRPVVLVYTSEADPQKIGKSIWQGANECLVQPFDAGILKTKLQQIGLL